MKRLVTLFVLGVLMLLAAVFDPGNYLRGRDFQAFWLGAFGVFLASTTAACLIADTEKVD